MDQQNDVIRESMATIRNASLSISAIIRKLRDEKMTAISAIIEINTQNTRIQDALALILKDSKI